MTNVTKDLAVEQEVTQQDREAAAARMFVPHTNPHRAMVGGLRDNDSLVQAFARHRLASTEALRAEIAASKERERETLAVLQTAHESEAALIAERDRLREMIAWAVETLQEINPSNYGHDEVCALKAIVYLTKQVEMANDSPRQAGALSQDDLHAICDVMIDVLREMLSDPYDAGDLRISEFQARQIAGEVFLRYKGRIERRKR